MQVQLIGFDNTVCTSHAAPALIKKYIHYFLKSNICFCSLVWLYGDVEHNYKRLRCYFVRGFFHLCHFVCSSQSLSCFYGKRSWSLSLSLSFAVIAVRRNSSLPALWGLTGLEDPSWELRLVLTFLAQQPLSLTMASDPNIHLRAQKPLCWGQESPRRRLLSCQSLARVLVGISETALLRPFPFSRHACEAVCMCVNIPGVTDSDTSRRGE